DEDDRREVRHGDDLDRAEADGGTHSISFDAAHPSTSLGTTLSVSKGQDRRACHGSRAERRHAYLIRSAALSASRRAVSLNGLNRHSTAPSASTRVRMVSLPPAV